MKKYHQYIVRSQTTGKEIGQLILEAHEDATITTLHAGMAASLVFHDNPGEAIVCDYMCEYASEPDWEAAANLERSPIWRVNSVV
jgi:hypothetical protein